MIYRVYVRNPDTQSVINDRATTTASAAALVAFQEPMHDTEPEGTPWRQGRRV